MFDKYFTFLTSIKDWLFNASGIRFRPLMRMGGCLFEQFQQDLRQKNPYHKDGLLYRVGEACPVCVVVETETICTIGLQLQSPVEIMVGGGSPSHRLGGAGAESISCFSLQEIERSSTGEFSRGGALQPVYYCLVRVFCRGSLGVTIEQLDDVGKTSKGIVCTNAGIVFTGLQVVYKDSKYSWSLWGSLIIRSL